MGHCFFDDIFQHAAHIYNIDMYLMRWYNMIIFYRHILARGFAGIDMILAVLQKMLHLIYVCLHLLHWARWRYAWLNFSTYRARARYLSRHCALISYFASSISEGAWCAIMPRRGRAPAIGLPRRHFRIRDDYTYYASAAYFGMAHDDILYELLYLMAYIMMIAAC